MLLLLHGCGVREGGREFNQRVEERRCVVCRVQAEKKTQERERVFPQQNFRMVEASERFKNIDVL